MIQLRKALSSDVERIRTIIARTEELDAAPETFSRQYITRIIRRGILLVALVSNTIVGICFGTHNQKENWADLLGLAVLPASRGQGIGRTLVRAFEDAVRHKNIDSIDLYADRDSAGFFEKLGYQPGRTYISFRKSL